MTLYRYTDKVVSCVYLRICVDWWTNFSTRIADWQRTVTCRIRTSALSVVSMVSELILRKAEREGEDVWSWIHATLARSRLCRLLLVYAYQTRNSWLERCSVRSSNGVNLSQFTVLQWRLGSCLQLLLIRSRIRRMYTQCNSPEASELMTVCMEWSDVTVICDHDTISMLWGNTAKICHDVIGKKWTCSWFKKMSVLSPS